jgi:hypothetical protein
MSRAKVRVHILCEDKMHEHFVRKLCEHRGLSPVRVLVAPKGRGSAEAWVRQRYPHEVRLLRQYKDERVALIAITDGDGGGVSKRMVDFADALTQQGLPARMNDERIAILVPTRSIETWLMWLCGVDDLMESEKYKNTPKWRQTEASPTKAVERFFLAPRVDEVQRLPALHQGRIELQRLVANS